MEPNKEEVMDAVSIKKREELSIKGSLSEEATNVSVEVPAEVDVSLAAAAVAGLSLTDVAKQGTGRSADSNVVPTPVTQVRRKRAKHCGAEKKRVRQCGMEKKSARKAKLAAGALSELKHAGSLSLHATPGDEAGSDKGQTIVSGQAIGDGKSAGAAQWSGLRNRVPFSQNINVRILVFIKCI